MLARCAIAALVLCGSARAGSWELRAAIGNDAFTEVIPPLDDQGFTNDLALAVQRGDGDLALGGSILHRMITSRAGRLRWDQLDLVATAERRWPCGLAAGAWLGPTFGGNFDGLAIQNRWHALSGTGPTIEEGLQDTYEGDRRVAVLAGVRGDASVGERVQGYGAFAGQLALGGTGVSRAEAAAGVRATGRLRGAAPGLHGELALTRYHTSDSNLELPGGYREGWQLEWRIGVEVAWSRYRLSYEYRANEGGSGDPIGVLAFAARIR